MKNCEQVFYNMGFKDAENSAVAIVFQARKFGLRKVGWQCWTHLVSLTPSLLQMPLNSLAQWPTHRSLAGSQPEDIDEEERGEGGGGRGDSPDMRELSQQIDSHMVVIDEENPTTATPIEMQGAP